MVIVVATPLVGRLCEISRTVQSTYSVHEDHSKRSCLTLRHSCWTCVDLSNPLHVVHLYGRLWVIVSMNISDKICLCNPIPVCVYMYIVNTYCILYILIYFQFKANTIVVFRSLNTFYRKITPFIKCKHFYVVKIISVWMYERIVCKAVLLCILSFYTFKQFDVIS